MYNVQKLIFYLLNLAIVIVMKFYLIIYFYSEFYARLLFLLNISKYFCIIILLNYNILNNLFNYRIILIKSFTRQY
jgi:hypothetical protein